MSDCYWKEYVEEIKEPFPQRDTDIYGNPTRYIIYKSKLLPVDYNTSDDGSFNIIIDGYLQVKDEIYKLYKDDGDIETKANIFTHIICDNDNICSRSNDEWSINSKGDIDLNSKCMAEVIYDIEGLIMNERVMIGDAPESYLYAFRHLTKYLGLTEKMRRAWLSLCTRNTSATLLLDKIPFKGGRLEFSINIVSDEWE